MIEPHELRIGNFVEVENYKIIQLENIHPKGTTKGDEIYLSSMLKPIELNEDWLLKFGFEKKAEHNFALHVLTRSIIHAYTHDKVEIELGNRTGYSFGYPAVKNVHQLQNLTFAITGEELKIKES